MADQNHDVKNSPTMTPSPAPSTTTTIVPVTNKKKCPECTHLFNLPDLFIHSRENHGLFSCLFCLTNFKYSKELMVHLHREHRVPPFKFSSGKEYLKSGGEGTSLLCVECNLLIHIGPNSDPNLISKHECSSSRGERDSKNSISTSTTTTIISASPAITHESSSSSPSTSSLKVKFKDIPSYQSSNLHRLPSTKSNSNENIVPVTSDSSISINEYPIKKLVSPSSVIIEPIKNEIQQAHANGNPPITTKINLRLSKNITIQPSPMDYEDYENEDDNFDEDYGNGVNYQVKSSSPSPEPQNSQQPSLDPLLLEPNPEKRIQILIKDLALSVSKSPKESFDPIELILSSSDTLESLTDTDLLTQMVDRSSNGCDYCKQAKLIRVDKRQLAIHLVSKHNWKIQFIQTIPFNNHLDSIDGVDIKPIIENGEQKVKVEEPTIPMDISENQNSIKTELLDEPKKEEHSDSQLIEEKNPLPLPPQKSSTEIEDMVPKFIATEDFILGLLSRVFQSPNLVYSYQQKKKLSFGLSSCQCLICGYLTETQLELFPHWRKAHRGMAMKCVMCHGKFLFAGALFSHLCLGTPQYFEKNGTNTNNNTPGTCTSLPLTTLPSQSGDSGLDSSQSNNESGNDTILLRYHCGICENLELPGFFNYMVHLRKDHHQCELCLEKVTSQKDLEHHMKKHKLNHFCWKCAVTYCAKPNFMTHLFWKHGTESQECSICLKKKWPHIYHFCIPPQVFTCDVCGLYFTRSKALLVHKRLHTKQNLKSCTECSAKFISKSLLQKHSIKVHSAPGTLLPPPQLPSIEQGSDSEKELNLNSVPKSESAQLNGQLTFDLAPQLPQIIDNSSMEEKPLNSSLKMNGEIEDKDTDVIPKLVNGEVDHKLDNSLPKLAGVIDGQGQDARVECLPSTGVDADAQVQLEDESTKEVPLVKNGTPSRVVDPTTEESPTKKLNKKSKSKDAKKFKLDSVLGPNLSEDESSSGDESSSCASEKPIPTPVPVPNHQKAEKSNSIERLSDTDSDSDSEINQGISNSTLPCVDSGISGLSMPSLDVFEELVQSPPFLLEPEDETDSSSKNELTALLTKPTAGVSPRLDLSSIATASLLEHEKSICEQQLPGIPEKTGNESPIHIPQNLLTVPVPQEEQIPIPDHITIENALLSLKMEHDYCKYQSLSLSKHKRKSVEPPKEEYETSSVLSSKKLKVKATLPSSRLPELLSQKRKRANSSSSSSSSSSCCGSNCSCSSSSSSSSSDSSSSDSDSSSDNEQSKKSIDTIPRHSIQSNLLDGKSKKGKLPKPQRPSKTKTKVKVKKPKGRPPKGNKKIKFMGKEQLSPEKGGGWGDNEILRHFDRPDDAFIVEEDLDTEDSGTEEIFHKKQLTETINGVPSPIDEPWTEGNEIFLLQQVRGVKDLEELRPKPEPIIEPKIKITKNPPIKSLIVRRSIGNELEAHSSYNENDTQEFIIGNTTIRGKGSFQTTVNSNPTKTTLTISRALSTPATSIPASSFIKSNKINNRNSRKPLPPALIPLNNNSPGKEESMHFLNSNSTPLSSGMRSDSLNSELHLHNNSILSSSNISSSSTPPTNPLDSTSKRRKARTKVTPRRQDKVQKVVIYNQPTPTPAPGPAEEADPQLYCICRGPHDAVSQMIGCDADDCQYQWFHFECVGVVVAPKGKWYCPDCRDKKRRKSFHLKSGDSTVMSPRPKNVNGRKFIGHPI